MSTYKSKVYPVSAAREQVFEKLSHPEALTEKIKNLPPELQEKLQTVKFGEDSISFVVPPMGEMRMLFTERTAPSRIVIGPESSPVPFGLSINIGEGADGGWRKNAAFQADSGQPRRNYGIALRRKILRRFTQARRAYPRIGGGKRKLV